MPVILHTTPELAGQLGALRDAPAIALDTEFHPEKAYTPRLMLLQLGPVGGEPILIDPLGNVDLTLLAPILESALLIVHGGAQDIGLIQRHTGASPRRIFDTQLAAGFAGLGFPRRLQDLLADLGGPTLDKGETLSDWSRRPLSADQLRYAADDVRVLQELMATLEPRIAALGNEGFFAAAQAEALASALGPPDDSRAWRRVPGAHLLADAERAALRALAAWREGRARNLDTPVGHLISDAVLLDVARRRPESIERLRENRRMPSQVWRQFGFEILQVLASAATGGIPRALPRTAQADALRLGARLLGEARGITGELLLSERELDYILEEKDSGSWRRSALGPAFDDLIAGRLLISARGALIRA